jgi:NADH-quinone oxidoreductase subunit G
MFGSLVKATLPQELGVPREDLVVVSIMPCTAKKSEARRPEFNLDGDPDIDFVITTQELGRMIQEAGLALGELEPEGMDQPYGSKSGAGIIFGNSGGVTEAVLRNLVGLEGAGEILEDVRGSEGRRQVTLELPSGPVRIAVVHGLANARALVEDVRAGREQLDFVEVMACPGGCAGGTGQPVASSRQLRQRRAESLRRLDVSKDLRISKDNACVARAYRDFLGAPNSSLAHQLLHTHYKLRKRISSDGISLTDTPGAAVPVSVCVGTSCHLRASQHLLMDLVRHVEEQDLGGEVEVMATFCLEGCDRGPTARVAGQVLHQADLAGVKALVDQALASHGQH